MKRYEIRENIISETAEEDMILINMDLCKILRLNFEGLCIWKLVERYDDANAIYSALQGQYSDIVCTQEDIEQFLAVLCEKGMLYEKV